VTLAPSVRTVVFRGFLQAQHLAAERGQDASDASDDELMEPSTKAQWRFPEMGNGSRSETT